jgi:hypothetical protein
LDLPLAERFLKTATGSVAGSGASVESMISYCLGFVGRYNI